MNGIIKFKGYKITYDELDNYFKEMKFNREERDRILEEIAFTHQGVLLQYSKNKPPIDDISINTFQFKTINEIKDDLCYKNLTSNINYSCNNALFHVLNNIANKKKEEDLMERIQRLEENSSIYIYTSIGCFILLAMRIFI
jgi:hypothetical protein